MSDAVSLGERISLDIGQQDWTTYYGGTGLSAVPAVCKPPWMTGVIWCETETRGLEPDIIFAVLAGDNGILGLTYSGQQSPVMASFSSTVF